VQFDDTSTNIHGENRSVHYQFLASLTDAHGCSLKFVAVHSSEVAADPGTQAGTDVLYRIHFAASSL